MNLNDFNLPKGCGLMLNFETYLGCLCFGGGSQVSNLDRDREHVRKKVKNEPDRNILESCVYG